MIIATTETPLFGNEIGNNSDGDNDSDDMQSVHFSEHMLARRRRRRRGVDVTAHIGANPNELLEDGSNIALRNWGLLTPGSDSADTMFADTPPPIIVNIFISTFLFLFFFMVT